MTPRARRPRTVMEVACVLLAAAMAACSASGPDATTSQEATAFVAKEVAPTRAGPVATPLTAEAAAPLESWIDIEARGHGDAARGKRLVARYECARCHEGTGEPAPTFERQCTGCHKRVMAGDLPFPRARLDGWRASLHHYVTTPNLADAGQTLRASWIASFLEEPVKVRSHMGEWMPRLGIPERDAADIAAYLTEDATPKSEAVERGDAMHGKQLAESSGCFECHDFRGIGRAEPSAAASTRRRALGLAYDLAPDLSLTRDRFRPDRLVEWIMDPLRMRHGTLMPNLGLSRDDARDIATYVLTTPLDSSGDAAPAFERLPLLERKVTYDEVASRVFKKGCIHCHADPDPRGGDSGPGSGGGFGFAPRGVRLTSAAGVELGYLTKGGTRRSLFAREAALDPWGGSRLVAALVVRHDETRGRPVAGVRGMPLGLPALSAEDIQLVETWVAQQERAR